MIMQKTELLIIYYLLQVKDNAGKSIRQIAYEAGVSVGSAFNTMKHLAEQGYLVDNGRTQVLRKRSALIDQWAQGYAVTLKPKMLLFRFGFIAPQIKEHWQNIALPQDFSWGGEPAAAILGNYMQPARWDIYTSQNANMLIATGRMIPNPSGEIFVYKRFWQQQDTPLLIIYADLLATGDDRCREVAELIKPLI